MGLKIGIVGLPNVGKSTLFNALASRRLAETAPRPFTTIDPHEAVVALPDEKLNKLHNILISQYPDIETVPATVTFIDIAGLVKDAHKGEGLGNQFLGKIREVDAIVHVVRAFKNPEVVQQSVSHDPGSEEQILEDIEIVNLELELGGVSVKPTIYVLNVGETNLNELSIHRCIDSIKTKFGGDAVIISAKLEEELIDLEKEERGQYLKESGIAESGLNQLIQRAYKLLDLISFYTIIGGKEVSAWSLPAGRQALDAAGQVHTDFTKGFIKAEVIPVDQLLELGSQSGEHKDVWSLAKEKGLVKLEGRDYVVQDEDVIEFKIGT